MLLRRHVHNTKLKILNSTLEHELSTIQSLLLVRNKEQMDVVRGGFDKLSNAHHNYVLELGYYTKKRKCSLDEKKKVVTPVVKPSDVVETYMRDSAKDGKQPTLGSLLSLLNDKTDQLKAMMT